MNYSDGLGGTNNLRSSNKKQILFKAKTIFDVLFTKHCLVQHLIQKYGYIIYIYIT